MRLALSALAALALGAHAGVTPSTMMANVFRFSEAGAVLKICLDSDAFKAVPAERAAALKQQAARIERLVKAIGQYYEDPTIPSTYDATRARIAGESRLRLHVKNHYEYCGEKLVAEMDKYLAENELLLGRYFSEPRPRARDKVAPQPGPPAGK